MSASDSSPASATAAERITTIGLGQIMRMAYEGTDLTPVWNALAERVAKNPADDAALMDMSTILLLNDQHELGMQVQTCALASNPLYRRPHGRADGLRVLAFVTGGDFMANTPIDFLLEGSDIELHLLYVAPGRPLPILLPEHDVALLAIAESDANAPVLAWMRNVLAAWPRPVFNGSPDRILALTRDGLCAMFANHPDIMVANTARASRATLEAIRDGAVELAAALPGIAFPIIVRPLDSHAGQGLHRLERPEELGAYLAERPEAAFFVSVFVDYRGADGMYRKARVAVVRGRPFASHMAVSKHWMVHYLNADMTENPERREEEARFMDGFDTGFGQRHRAAFETLYREIGLDYFAIDCAELPDGRLLMFEASVAMIVHALDPVEIFPYKKPAMEKLFANFQEQIKAFAEAAP